MDVDFKASKREPKIGCLRLAVLWACIEVKEATARICPLGNQYSECLSFVSEVLSFLSSKESL